jgi:hypothetical protein
MGCFASVGDQSPVVEHSRAQWRRWWQGRMGTATTARKQRPSRNQGSRGLFASLEATKARDAVIPMPPLVIHVLLINPSSMRRPCVWRMGRRRRGKIGGPGPCSSCRAGFAGVYPLKRIGAERAGSLLPGGHGHGEFKAERPIQRVALTDSFAGTELSGRISALASGRKGERRRKRAANRQPESTGRRHRNPHPVLPS